MLFQRQMSSSISINPSQRKDASPAPRAPVAAPHRGELPGQSSLSFGPNACIQRRTPQPQRRWLRFYEERNQRLHPQERRRPKSLRRRRLLPGTGRMQLKFRAKSPHIPSRAATPQTTKRMSRKMGTDHSVPNPLSLEHPKCICSGQSGLSPSLRDILFRAQTLNHAPPTLPDNIEAGVLFHDAACQGSSARNRRSLHRDR